MIKRVYVDNFKSFVNFAWSPLSAMAVAWWPSSTAPSSCFSQTAPRWRAWPIAELVPRRNIESWLYAPDEELAVSVSLNETSEYPKLKGRESDAARAAKLFGEHAKHGSFPETIASVPSLRDGLDELQRLP